MRGLSFKKLFIIRLFGRKPTKRRLLGSFLFLILCVGIFSFVLITTAKGATRTWDGGCGANTDWSCDANWSTDTEPVSGDTVIFDNTSDNNSTIDATWTGTISNLLIQSGYDGTITAARSLTVSGDFNQASGSFNGSSQTITIRIFTLSAGVFTASSGTTTVTGPFTVSGSPTFNANGGTVSFNSIGLSGSPVTYSCNNVTFNLVTMDGNSAANGTTTISSNCTLPLGDNPTVDYTDYAFGSSTLNMNGTLTGTGILSMTGSSFGASIVFGSTAVLSGFSGFSVADSATPFSTSATTLDLGAYTTVNFDNSFTLTTGTFTAPSGTMTVAGSFTISAGTFNPNSGTLIFDGNGALSCNDTVFSTVRITGNAIVGTNCSLDLGNSPTISSLTLRGTITGTGTLTTNTFTQDNASANFSGFSNFVSNFTFALSAGTFTAPAAMSIIGNFTVSGSPTFNANGGTVNFNSGNSGVTLSCGNITFNRVTIDGNASASSTYTISSNCTLPLGDNPTVDYTDYVFGSSTLNMNGTLTGTGTLTMTGSSFGTSIAFGSTAVLSGFNRFSADSTVPFTTSATTLNMGTYSSANFDSTFTLASGTFTAPSGIMTVASTLTKSGGTFTHNNGTVFFDGSGSQTIVGAFDFGNLMASGTSSKTLIFPANTTQTVANSITFSGTALASKMLIRSSSSGTKAMISAAGPNDIKWVDVRDIDACSGHLMIAINSTNTGNNSCWSFVTSGAKNPTYILKGVQIGPGVRISGT